MKVDIDEEFEDNEVSPSSDDAGEVGAAATAVGGGVLSALAPTDVEGPDPHVAAGELAADEVVDVEVVAVVAAGNGSMVANKGKLTESRMRSASYVAVSYDRREYVSRRLVQRGTHLGQNGSYLEDPAAGRTGRTCARRARRA